MSSNKNIIDHISGLFSKKPGNNENINEVKSDVVQKAGQLNSAIDQLKNKLEKRRQESGKTSVLSTISAGVYAKKTSSLTIQNPEDMKRDLALAQARLKESVIKLHQTLGTNLTVDKLSNLQDRILSLAEDLKGTDTEVRIKKAIVSRVFKETGEMSWYALLHNMHAKDINWELPTSQSAGISEDLIDQAISEREIEIKELFINQTPAQSALVLDGIIEAWKRYPDENSWLWKEVCLRAVGTGIRSALFIDAVDLIKNQAEQLRTKASELMAESLDQINSLLQTSLHSIEDAEMIVSNSERIINEIIPELAWEMIEDKCNQEMQKYII